LDGLSLSGGLDTSTFFKGKLDVGRVALAGHSFGGATVTSLAGAFLRFRWVLVVGL
jgi:predicted dienelactone hydrolase